MRKARENALHNQSSSKPDFQQKPSSNLISDLGFDEVPATLLRQEDWTVVWSKPWAYEGNILNTEARALLWSVEHLLRATRCIQKRPLCLSDNLPLVLSATKGRGRSHHLTRPWRKLAALSLAIGSSELNVADRPSRALVQRRPSGMSCA